MTVEQVGEKAMVGGQTVWCSWFIQAGRQPKLERETFPPESLEKVTPLEISDTHDPYQYRR
jgi:hypothetical protein